MAISSVAPVSEGDTFWDDARLYRVEQLVRGAALCRHIDGLYTRSRPSAFRVRHKTFALTTIQELRRRG